MTRKSGGGFRQNWPRFQRRLRRKQAHLLAIDDSGLLLMPLVRRTLAPCGHTPVLAVKSRHRETGSLVAGLTWSPQRRHIGLHYRTYPKPSVNYVRTARFLK